MQNLQKKDKSMSGHGFTQFELTQKLLQNLNNFKLTPTAKLVLLYLSSCYNPKHKDMFPKQRTIADKIGVSEVSVTRAISELHKEGLVISERKYSNRYKYTSKFLSLCGISEYFNLIEKNNQNDNREDIKLIGHDIEQTKEQNKKPIEVEDYKILRKYAKNHNARNINAYIKWMQKEGIDKNVLREHKQISRRYQTNALKHIEAINNEEIERVPSEYLANIRKKLVNNLS